MKKHSKIYGAGLFIICLGVYIGVFNGDSYKIIDKNQVTFEFTPVKLDSKGLAEKEKLEKKLQSEADRAPASIPPQALLPEWQTKLKERLTHSLRSWDAEAKVKSLGSRTFKSGTDSIGAEHVVVSIDQGDGNISSYEAYVHPQTGAILKTWNQTRFENKKALRIKAKPLDTAL